MLYVHTVVPPNKGYFRTGHLSSIERFFSEVMICYGKGVQACPFVEKLSLSWRDTDLRITYICNPPNHPQTAKLTETLTEIAAIERRLADDSKGEAK